MAEEAEQEQGQQEQQREFAAITSQEQLDQVLAKRLERERAKFAGHDELKAKAARLDEIEEANKTELQKLQERLDVAERSAQEKSTEALRARLQAKHRLSDEDATAFLTGSDEESLTLQAERIAAIRSEAPRPPRPNPAQGHGEATASGDWLRDQFARR